jgi:PAS domain S-box-containing protein
MSQPPGTLTTAACASIEAYAIIGLDRQGIVTSWNAGAERLFGASPGEAIGRRLDGLVEQDDGALSTEVLDEMSSTGIERGSWLRGRDGRRFWAKTTTAAVPGEDGGVAGYALVVRDATPQREARDELLRSKMMFEGILAIASDAVVCVDESQRVVFFNEGAERIFNYSPNDILGQPLELLIPERHRPAHAARVREFGESGVVARQMGDRGEISGRRKDGEVFPAAASISKLDLGERRIYTAVLRDVTERRAAAEALERQTQELARSNAELEQFAYVASHDLQEPLRMVASYTQLLARRYQGQLDDDAEEFIGFAVDGVTRMQALINDLLAYSRVGTRGGEFRPVPLDDVLEKVIATLRPSMDELGAVVTHDPLPVAVGDPGQLHQLFQNLLQNAIKFQRRDVRPEVRVGVMERPGEWEIAVRDNGIGIADEFRDRIFVIFQRLHNRTEYPGTGIGLAICKKIVERHGGHIWVESSPGEGSTFHFTLPKDGQDE